MKIILASDGSFLLKNGYNLLGIPKDKIRIGYVTTASQVSENKTFVETHKKEMTKAGYNYQEFDIAGKTKKEVLDFFSDKNVIHIEGGNAFYLLKVIREIGFDKILNILLDKGVAYVGTSAGSYIMCPNIEVATWRRNVEEQFGLTDLTALNYTTFCLKVHYTDDMKEIIKEKRTSLKHPLRILRNGQGLMYVKGDYQLVGPGKEVKV